jgi:putative Holliday junction resolvase
MGRLMSIDYGAKRCGIAVTDILRIIPNALQTVLTVDLLNFLKEYLKSEPVDILVIGYPTHLDGNPTYVTKLVDEFLVEFSKQHPTITVCKIDEWFTSSQAMNIIIQSGVPMKKRRDKSLVDKVAAVLILEDFMSSRQYKELLDKGI